METILITGGSGFLGKYLIKKYCNSFSIIALYLHNKPTEKFKNCKYIKLDLRNKIATNKLFSTYNPTIIIHTASIKNIKKAEENPTECIDINVTGSINLAEAAIANNCKTVLGISSIKAAQPSTSMYALSKATMERLFVHYNNTSTTKFACLRIGNIMYAPDTVLDFWSKMILQKKKITTTGYDMIRYFNTLSQIFTYTNAVLKYSEKAAGKIITPQMNPVRIKDLLHIFAKNNKVNFIVKKTNSKEQKDEYLVQKDELIFTNKTIIDSISFFVKSAEKLRLPLKTEISAIKSSKMKKDIIKNNLYDKE